MAEIHYLNVDLEIESRDPLDAVLDEFGEEVVVMYKATSRGMHQASVAIAGMSGDADTTINRLCDLVGYLEPPTRELWNRCVSRVFDVGYDSGDTPANFRSILQPKTLARVAAVGASIAITIYPLGMPFLDPDEQQEARPDDGA